MEAHLYIEAKTGMIGAATDFTYKWCINVGLDAEDAARMALAVDEVLTDITLYAYSDTSGYAEIWYQYSFSEIEIIIQETGEPFDPNRHTYSKDKTLKAGNFEGAGIEIARKMSDHFVFLNRGKDGKEYRLVKSLDNSRIRDLPESEPAEDQPNGSEPNYILTAATENDAEDIAKLIYQSYDYSYNKEDLYFPRRIEMAIRHGYKFGVIARTSQGSAAGYFAVIRSTDSLIGEVGEAVVSPPHRNRGLMKRMIRKLIEMSHQRRLLGLYGMALTVHTISQKVNEKFGFKSTSLMLARAPESVYKGLSEEYPQPVSMLMDFLPLSKNWNMPVYLPRRYHDILLQTYKQFGNYPEIRKLSGSVEKDLQVTAIDLNISYEGNSAVIIVRTYGDTFESSCLRIFKSLEELNLNAIYIDLPLNHPWVEPATEWLIENGFIFAGLIPLFHKERDYLRLQKVNVDLDFDLIETYSEMSVQLKEKIADEYHEIQKRPT